MNFNFTISILILPFFVFSQSKKNQETDSLYNVWEDTSFHDTLRADAFQAFIFQKYFRTNLDSAMILSKEHLQFTKQSKNGKRILNSYLLNSMVSSQTGDYKTAIDYSYKALNDSFCENRWKCQATFHNTLGNIYTFMGENTKALKQYNTAINFQISNNGDSSTIGFLYSNIGNIYQSIDKDSALFFFNKSLEIQTALNDQFRIAQVNWNIGNTFSNNPKKQIPYYKESFEFFKKLNYKTYLSSLANNIAIAYNKLDDIKNAEKYSKICLQNALESNSSLEILKANKINSLIHQKKGDFSKALSFYESAILIGDSLNRASNRKAMHESEIKYAYEKKLRADKLFELEEQKIHQAKVDLQNAKIHANQTISNLVIVVLFLFVMFSVIIWYRFQKSQEKKKLIKNQKQKVGEALIQLEVKKKAIERKTLEILDSIHYAKYIQNSLLPENEELDKFFNKHVVFNLPKDIVGGDFYWFKSFGDQAIIIAADCTGHGVPGGFITMLGNLFIETSISSGNKHPDKILKDLNRDIVTFLKQDEEDAIQDGMDISICLIDRKKRKILFSGARNGIFIVDGASVKSINGSISPVGGFYSKKEKFKEREYELQEISIGSKEWVFMYTDGFYDQFGGDKGRSMGSKKFKEILINAVKEEKVKASNFKNHFFNWMGDYPQIDDVLLVGFKV